MKTLAQTMTTLIIAGAMTSAFAGEAGQDERRSRLARRRHRMKKKEEVAKGKRNSEKETQGKTKQWTAERDATVTKNDDGTKTIVVDGTKTLKNGETVETHKETTVTKTEDGRTWETDATRTGSNGTSTMTATGTATKTEGGADVAVDREGTKANGTTWTSTTEGTTQRTENGRTWTSNTNGENSNGDTWETDRTGKAVRTGNGTVHRNVHGTTTVNDERTVNWHRHAKATKTESGRHVQVKGNRRASDKDGKTKKSRRKSGSKRRR